MFSGRGYNSILAWTLNDHYYFQVATWSAHKEKVNLLFLFGDLILSTDVKGNLFIWTFKNIEQNLQPVSHIVLEDKFSPTCIMHPDTYLNKVKLWYVLVIDDYYFLSILRNFSLLYFHILQSKTNGSSIWQVIIGSQEGSFHLWNINTQKKLFEFKGWNSSVHCCVSSPALDVVAFGCSDGKVHVHNVRYDEEIVSFSHSTHGAVTSLSFRTGTLFFSILKRFFEWSSNRFDCCCNMRSFLPSIC